MKCRGRGNRQLPELEWRRRATQATLDRYRAVPFDWAARQTCVHLAAFHLRNMGHRPPAVPGFTTPAGARKALTDRGWDSVSAMLDSMLEPIAPARMLLGDLAVVAGSDGMEAIVICTGPQALLGWLPGGESMAVHIGGIAQVTRAWRV